ncbi:TPA: hypothetical protein ACW7QF_001904 [Klebsiella aerogenes]|uniref:hypothetical protein n=1 Tax=Klebsiella TaxID=570 RepID=UPI0029288384|nr:hypothetical protein [Klebsiella sp. 141203]MDU9363217.1 hypothetical protein [Klebsiella sp. 141203]HEP0588679.1 hypothetical protein [Klebsiella aerogenes]
MNITNLNAHALINITKSLIEMLRNNKKATISKVVTEWNICVEQSGYTTTFDFPVEGRTRKAQVIADLERCAAQLEKLAFATETLTVRASNNEVQTTDVLINEEVNVINNRIQRVQQQVNQLANVFVVGSYMDGFMAMHNAVGECRNILNTQGITLEQQNSVCGCLAQCAVIFHEVSEATGAPSPEAVSGGFRNDIYPNA